MGYGDTNPSPSINGGLGFVWTQALGLRTLPDYLLARHGVSISGLLSTANRIEAVSDDGRLFLVSDSDSTGLARLTAIRIVVPEVSPAGLLGSSLPLAGLLWGCWTINRRKSS